jgi:hypothetical protein
MSDPGREELFEIYPNPATGNVHIRCNESMMKGRPGSLQIIDINGRTVWAGRQQSQIISVDGWAAGTYTVRGLGNENACEKKLLIQ